MTNLMTSLNWKVFGIGINKIKLRINKEEKCMSIWEGTKDKEHLSDQDYLYLILFYLSGIIVSVMAYSYLSKQEEYIENESVTALATLIKQKINEKLNPAE